MRRESLGFASFGPVRNKEENRLLTGEIYSIYVLEEFWNLGIGRTLMENSLTALGERWLWLRESLGLGNQSKS